MKLICELLDSLLPRVCPSCGNQLNINEEGFCINCCLKLELASADRLYRGYNKMFKSLNFISGFTAFYVFEKDKEIQHIIHAIKYKNKFGTGMLMGKLLGMKIQNENWKVDLVIPVPLHPVKKAERGYNQSYYIAVGVNKILGNQIDCKTLKRIRYTETQTTKDSHTRAKNISGAFSVKHSQKIIGKNVLIIDDIVTTGNTVSECAKVLHNSGAENIYIASIAIAD